jgi:hypothetical protein
MNANEAFACEPLGSGHLLEASKAINASLACKPPCEEREKNEKRG